MSITDFLSYANVVLTVCLLVGGILAIRQGYSKAAGEIQEKVIVALKEQVATLEKQAGTDEREIKHLKQVLLTVRYALKRRGLAIEVNGESITLIDEQSRTTRTVAIRTTEAALQEDES